MLRSILLFSLILIGSELFSQTLVKDIITGSSGSSPSMVGAINGKLIFFANDISKGREPFVSDGTTNGTFMLKDLLNTGSSISSEIFRVLDTMSFFFARTDQSTLIYSLFVTNGTTKGTIKLMDLYSSTLPSNLKNEISDVNGKLVFVNTTSVGRELWVSDGTVTGTRMLKDINPTTYAAEPLNLTKAGNQLFFYANDDDHGQELWVSDGTESGTRLVKDIFPGTVSSLFSATQGPGMFAFGDKVMFCAIEELKIGFELFISDGTDTGTRLVKDIYPGDYHHSTPTVFAACDKFALMFATNSKGVSCLYRSDGTETGTYCLIEDTLSKVIKTSNLTSINLGDKAIFSMFYTDFGSELWVSDGTPQGTQILIDAQPGPNSGFNGVICLYKSNILFAAQNSLFGRELWISDGTQDNTKLFMDINIGQGSSGLFSLCVMDDYLYSGILADNLIGIELYKIPLKELNTGILHVASPSLLVYPNPVTRGQSIKFSEQVSHFELYDLQGKLIFESQSEQESINLPNEIPSGTYYVSAVGETGIEHLILIIED